VCEEGERERGSENDMQREREVGNDVVRDRKEKRERETQIKRKRDIGKWGGGRAPQKPFDRTQPF